jgi:hypothetical protein
MNKLANVQYKLYSSILIITYIVYFLALFGVTLIDITWLDKLEGFIQIYVSVFLVYRFNPFSSITFNELDRKIAFSAGVFLLMTTSINSLVKIYFDDIKTYIKSYN